MTNNNLKNVIIVGGGLVGSLSAIFMAKRGYHVAVFECREDIRSAKMIFGRSINLTLSNRGRRALAAVGLEQLILQSAIPLKGRMLHDIKGNSESVSYDARTGQCIYSIGRTFLNKILLTELEKHPNVKIYFNHKLFNVNFESETITLLNIKSQEMVVHSGDLIIGADGAYSTLRRFTQQTPLFEYSQTYIKDGYLELKILGENGNKMVPNHLHIWPREKFMMIALPNQDNSWTVTLFMPFSYFKLLKNSDDLIRFFKNTFPDALSLIGDDLLVADFFKMKPSPLISIKCNPYCVGRKFLIIGDAAHAMVPFYGQGMNAGFEDCYILDKILDKNKNDVVRSVQEFSNERIDDAFAICDLAMYNYVEMRDLVTKRSYRWRKIFDEVLFKLFPEKWVPLYNSVTFSDMGYRRCFENREWQNQTIQRGMWLTFSLIIAVIASVFKIL